jgi:hypothetical protein
MVWRGLPGAHGLAVCNADSGAAALAFCAFATTDLGANEDGLRLYHPATRRQLATIVGSRTLLTLHHGFVEDAVGTCGFSRFSK